MSVAVNPGARLGHRGAERDREVDAAAGAGRAGGARRRFGRAVARRRRPSGFLPQEPDADPGETLRAYLARRTGVAAAVAGARRGDARAGRRRRRRSRPTATALEHYLAIGGDDLDARTGAVLAEVGLPADRLDVAVGHLSRRAGRPGRARRDPAVAAGRAAPRRADQRPRLRRARPARAVRGVDAGGRRGRVARPDVPRPHASTRILELRLPDHDAVEHAGGWSDFVESRELARRQQHEGYEKYTAERDRLQQRQRTQREWAVVGVKNAKAKKTDNDKFLPHLKSQRSEKMAAKVKATEKAIERLEVVDKPWEPWQLQLELKAATRGRRRGRPARSGGGRARLVPARPDRPRGRLAGPPRHRRSERLRQDHAAAGAPRRGRAGERARAGSDRA